MATNIIFITFYYSHIYNVAIIEKSYMCGSIFMYFQKFLVKSGNILGTVKREIYIVYGFSERELREISGKQYIAHQMNFMWMCISGYSAHSQQKIILSLFNVPTIFLRTVPAYEATKVEMIIFTSHNLNPI